MARRFITVEDIRRAGSGELLVDSETLVTPQALEAAQAAGVVIRNAGGGEYQEPTPNRGPDAALSGGQLPEPDASEASDGTGVVITAVGQNRAGVLAEITALLAQASVDVHEISQRIIEDHFHLVLTAQLASPSAFSPLKEQLQCLGGEDDYIVRVMHKRVFRFMHRV